MEDPRNISIKDYTYELPESRIAVYPREKREDSKLLIYKAGEIKEDVFQKVTSYLPKNSLLLFNNTEVIPARLKFKTAKDRLIEIFCLEPWDTAPGTSTEGRALWKCMVGNLRHWKEKEIKLQEGELVLTASLHKKADDEIVVEFKWQPPGINFMQVLGQFGAVPIPPYLKRESEAADTTRYQTIYAQHKGSVAAPTAGLHFTPEILDRLKEQGVGSVQLTLHVGAGTFMPVKSATMEGHMMHHEWIEVNSKTLETLRINARKKIIAVGTTSLRTIESLYWMGVKAATNMSQPVNELEIGQWEVYNFQTKLTLGESLGSLLRWMDHNNLEKFFCRTRILIAPSYEIRAVSGLITNFHQPNSTLLLLVAAFVGEDWKKIYQYALKNDFRFLSYGDSSLLLK